MSDNNKQQHYRMSTGDDDADDDVEIMESTPEFRSVAMLSRHPNEVMSPGGICGGGPFHSRAGLKQKTPPKAHGGFATSTSIGSDIIFGDSTAPVWNVTTPLLAVPAFYKLERTHVRMSSAEVPLNQVTKRIVDSIRNEAIAAVYDPAEAKVSGETKCNVKFVLRLWSGGSDNDTIIVECQRESGCSFTFCETAKKILKAAKTGIIKKKKNKTSSTKEKNIVPEEDPSSLVQDSLNIARDHFINCDRVDYHVLATETLAHLSASPFCRLDCSRAIVVAESGSDVLDIIVSLIVCSRLEQHSEPKKKDKDTLAIETEHYDAMHRHALTVLANCLSTLEEYGELESALSSGGMMTSTSKLVSSSDLLNALIRTVASSASKPHEASDAYKCIEMLCLRSDYVKERVVEIMGGCGSAPQFY